MKKTEILRNGIISRNPVFFLILGLCPTLAVTTSLDNGLGMGAAALFVLVLSNAIISSLRNIIPSKIRIPSYIVIIATFVTLISMLLQAYFPDLFDRLGIYVPLIVVNCIILGRAEAFARKNGVIHSVIDGFSMGIGFTLALIIIGSIREIIGTSSLIFLGKTVFALQTSGAMIMILPPGALLTIGIIIASLNYFKYLKNFRSKKEIS